MQFSAVRQAANFTATGDRSSKPCYEPMAVLADVETRIFLQASHTEVFYAVLQISERLVK